MPSIGVRSLFVGALMGAWVVVAMGQGPVNRVRPIDESQVVTLAGNVHPMARGEFDAGVVEPEMQLDRMILELEPSSAQQAELDALVEAQHDPDSPLFHQWLTPAEYAARFGVSAQDLARVTGWLASHGFQVDEVAASNRQIVFSGTAGQVLDTFHTEIHHLLVNGESHLANVQDPQIPAAMAGVVGGVVSLHDFRRQGAISSRTALASTETRALNGAKPQFSSGTTNYLFPADWAAIYDLNSLYSAGTTGKGTTIAIVGRSNINLSDVATFRSTSALAANAPTVVLVSTDPGLVAGDQDESTLDVEWSGAVAPGAAVKFVVGASTNTTDGVDLSAQYVVNHTAAQVVSTSYGSCEEYMGTTELAFYNGLWEQAAGEGMSAFVSSGDSGASGCDGGSSTTGSGQAVNGLCSSPYSTCVGGTEFNEGANDSKYWSSTNGAGDESALGYIPEKVWNESASDGGSGLWSSGGGVSLVYPQPSFQKGVSGTSAANGMRAVPDVAMSAAGHDGYIIVEDGSYWIIAGTSAASPSFAGVMALVVQSKGGTGQGNANAGLYPLVNATHNPFHATPSGNNSVPGVTGFTASGNTYNLATGLGSVDGAVLVSEWGSGSGGGSKDFTLTPSATSGTVLVGKSTTFTIGATASGTAKNTIALKATAPTGVTAGISPASILPGASATVTIAVGSTAASGSQSISITGTDSTGTQTVTYALTVTPLPTLALTAASSAVSVPQGGSGTVSLTATTGGSYSGNIGLSVSGLPTGVTAGWSANPIAGASGSSTNSETLTLTATPTATVGSATISVTATGDSLTASQTVTVQVQSPGVTLAATPTSVSVQSLATATVTVTATPAGGAAIPAAAAGSSISVASGLPKGFTAAWSAPAVNSNGAAVWTLTLTGSSTAAAGTSTLGLTAKVAAKSGTTYTASLNVPMTVTLSPPALTVTPASTSLSLNGGTQVTDVVSLTGNSLYSGAATMSVSGLPSGVTASWSANPVTLTSESGKSTLTLTASSSVSSGTATITVTATGDGVSGSHQVSLTTIATVPTLTVTPASSTMTVINPTEAVSASQSVASQVVSFTGGGSFKGTIALSVSGLPSNLTASWSSNPVTLNSSNSGTSTLTVTAGKTSQGATVTPGTYSITVTATGGGLTVSKTITVQVEGASAKPSATTLTIHRGTTGSFSIAVTTAGGATGVLEPGLAANAAPSGITASATPGSVSAPAGGTITFTLTVSSTAALTTYQLEAMAVLLPTVTSTTPTLVGTATAPITLNIVQ